LQTIPLAYSAQLSGGSDKLSNNHDIVVDQLHPAPLSHFAAEKAIVYSD
jgi:hypothetical protein